MGISFSRPWYLLLLLLAIYYVYLWLRSAKAFRAWQQKLFLGLRLLIVVLLVLALAGVQFTFKHKDRNVVYVADLSASVLDQKKEAQDWIAHSLAALPQDVKAGVVSLGKKPVAEYPVGYRSDFTGLQAVVDKNYTDLASGLRLAGSMLPEDQAKQIVLLTDGKQNRGDALEAAAGLQRQGVRVDVEPLLSESGPEVAVKDLGVPAHLKEGEEFNIQAALESTVPTSGTARIMVGNKVLRQEKVQLSKGSNKLVWGAGAEGPGFYTYRLEITAAEDTRVENNVGMALTEVSGAPRVLLVEGAPGEAKALQEALTAVKMQADTTAPEGMPKDLPGLARYAGVVLVNVPATRLPEQTMTALENYIKDLGRGLVMVGGEDSFGPGGYFNTPVERALPVHMDIRKNGEIPSIGLEIVLDKSGSMCHTMNGVRKIDMAKEAAIRSTEILTAKDQLGVITFDSEYKWVVKTAPLNNKQEVQDKIASIEPSGGTNLFPALEAAYNSLKDAKVKVKHIILLSDGVSQSGGNYDELVGKLNEAKITLTTVALGSDSDTGLLKRLAEAGKGRYYYTDDISTIPKIFAKETFLASRSYIVQEPFTPALTGSPSMLPANRGMPPLLGYVGTTAKDTAEVILASPKDDPVLARWSYGLGRAAAWTSDAKGRWAGQWLNWSGFAQFWGKVISWTLPQEQDNGMILSASRDGGEGKITVEMPGERRAAHDLQARIIAPDGSAVESALPAQGPGRYQAGFPMEQQGTYMVQVIERSGDQVVREQTTGLVQPYSPEYQIQPDQREFLQQLASAGGGQVLQPGGGADLVGKLAVPAVTGRVPLSPWALALATLLLPLDIAARRFNLNLKSTLWLRLKNRLSQRARRVEHAPGALVESMQERKLAREQFYQGRVKQETSPGSEPAEPARTAAAGKSNSFKPVDTAEARERSKEKLQSEASENEGKDFTARLLAAKKRSGRN